MKLRAMRIIIFFDLPVTTSVERKAYTKFRKGLMNEGFIMLQESIYCKLALNMSSVNLILTRIKRIKPSKGLVQALIITEKQYGSIINMVGEQETNIINDSGRLTIL